MADEKITTSLEIDISNFKKNITEANKQIKLANAEFKAASAGMDDWKSSTEGISAKLDQLNKVLASEQTKLKAYEAQLQDAEKTSEKWTSKTEELRKALQEMADKGVDPASKEYKELERELAASEKAQAKAQSAVDKAKISLINQQGTVNGLQKDIKNYDGKLEDLNKTSEDTEKESKKASDGIEDVGKKSKDTESKVGSLASKLSDGLVKGFKVVAAAATAAAGAIGVAAVKGFAENEQLVGGIETLFGAGGQSLEEYAASVGKSVDEARGEYDKLMNAQSKMFDYANSAYETAGLSANEYMEQATAMSASLIQSLGGDTEKAADKANQALIDMSDNANKMGSDISSIQDAYSGFAKGNYTMLDNLKLGYGGTQKEMERLLKDAEAISGVHYDVSSYADVVDAIHVIQEDMGIAGTTAKEATETISGSFGMLQSSLGNLMAGLGDADADLQGLAQHVIDAFSTLVDNVIPVLQNIVTALPPVIDSILEAFQSLLPELLPIAISMVETLISGIVSMLPSVSRVLQLMHSYRTSRSVVLFHIPS